MNDLLNIIISNKINKLVEDDEYGILVSNLPSIDISKLCQNIDTSKKELCFYVIGAEQKLIEELSVISIPRVSISFSVEDAENSRNDGDESKFRIIVLKRNDIQKVSSLEWFNKITMSDVYKLSCDYVDSHLVTINAFIKAFLKALKSSDIKKILNFEDVIQFLDQMRKCNETELQNYIQNNMTSLGLCSDQKIVEQIDSDKIKLRLKDNKRVLNLFGDLDKKERSQLNKYASENPSDDTPKYILEYYQTKNKSILKQIDYEKALLCLKVSKSGPIQPRNREEKLSPTAFGAKLVFDNKMESIASHLEHVKKDFDNEQSIQKKSDLIEENKYATSLNYDFDSVKILDKFVTEDTYGCAYFFDSESPSDAISKCDKYEPQLLNDDLIQKEVFDYLEKFSDMGVESSIEENLKNFIEARKKIIPFKNRLNDFAMLQVIEQHQLFYDYLSAYEKLLASIEDDYWSLAEMEAETAKDVIGFIMSLDFVYFISDDANNTYAIPTSVNILYLWKYIKLTQEILDSRNITDTNEINYLSEKDKDFIIRKSEDIPDPLTLYCVPSTITGSSTQMLPLNGKLGVLPVYSAKQLIDDSYSNVKDIVNVIQKYIALYPHSQLNIQLGFVNPPSVDMIAKVINQFDNYSCCFDITILKTRESRKNWVTIDDDTLNAGLFSKLKNEKRKNISLKVIDKVINYTDIVSYLEGNKHLLFLFDPNEKKIEMSSNDVNISISPLCVPKVYEYNPLRNTRKVSSADSETIFSKYTVIVEKIKDQSGASIRHSKVYTYSPLNFETYRQLLEKTDWMVIFDKNLKIWDVALNSNSEKLYFSESNTRSIGVYSCNAKKLIDGYTKILKDLGNFFPNSEAINSLINNIRMVNNDGLLSVISKATNQIFDYNHGKGSLGLAITTMLYKLKYPNAILVGLDTQLARIWLAGRDESILPDLVAIRNTGTDEYVIDIIEIKSYSEYSLNDFTISGHSVEQVNVLVDLLKEMFTKNEKITTIARREVLRSQVYDYIFNYIVPKEKPSTEEGRNIVNIIKGINKLFSGDAIFDIRKNIAHVDFSSVNNCVLLCNTLENSNRDILLNVIGANYISKIVSNVNLDGSSIPFFDRSNAGLYVTSDSNNPLEIESFGVDAQEDLGIKKDYTIPEDSSNDNNNNIETVNNEDESDAKFSLRENNELVSNNCKNLYTILKDYGIRVKPIDSSLVQVTSRFYRFKIELLSGETIRSIERYKDDISRGLEAQGPIMISNIPGTKYVAIDVCYDLSPAPLPLEKNLKYLDDSNGVLDILAGETVDGTFKIIDLAQAVHMLVAGTTGSGKTLFLYSLICSLLYKYSEQELDFIFVDPKQTDFVFFSNLKTCHDKKIITDPAEAIGMIKWINEVERPRRVNLFKQSMARDIISYNAKNPNNKLKRIVFIIDEYADLVRTADNLGTRKEFENSLSQAAAMVRSLGIHIILATQWASSSIVTSAIKANFPFRISFKLPQHQDSSTILDRSGAEDLLGKGDMLILDNGVLTRVQSCYIDADNELGDFLKKYE